MVEVNDYMPPEYLFLGNAHLRAQPGPELTQALERFVNPEKIRSLGSRVLELRSEQSVGVYSGSDDHDTDWRRPNITKADLVKMSVELDRRRQTFKPKLAPDVSFKSLAPPEGAESDGPGIDMRFRVALDDLTKRVLRNTVLLDSEDGELYMHVRLRRPDMQLGPKLLDARNDLEQLLGRAVPEPLDSFYLKHPNIHG